MSPYPSGAAKTPHIYARRCTKILPRWLTPIFATTRRHALCYNMSTRRNSKREDAKHYAHDVAARWRPPLSAHRVPSAADEMPLSASLLLFYALYDARRRACQCYENELLSDQRARLPRCQHNDAGTHAAKMKNERNECCHARDAATMRTSVVTTNDAPRRSVATLSPRCRADVR